MRSGNDHFLSPFHKISMDFQNGDMGLNSAIPSYSELFNHVEDWRTNVEEKMGSRSLSDVIAWKTALEKSQDVLRKYYSKTDSRLYSSVTYCDPRRDTTTGEILIPKNNGFQRQKGEP
jgi:hypothetical protein